MITFFEKMDKLKPFFDTVYKVVLFIAKLLLVIDVLITCMSVLGRYVSFIPDPAWSEEIVLTCMAYMAVVSGALALRRNAHIRMTAIDPYLPKRLVQALDLLADLAVTAFAIFMVVEGWKYCTGIGGKGYYTSLPWLSKFWQYLPIPMAGVAMIVFELELIYNHIKVFFIEEVKAE